jgi:hypothetical protein
MNIPHDLNGNYFEIFSAKTLFALQPMDVVINVQSRRDNRCAEKQERTALGKASFGGISGRTLGMTLVIRRPIVGEVRCVLRKLCLPASNRGASA